MMVPPSSSGPLLLLACCAAVAVSLAIDFDLTPPARLYAAAAARTTPSLVAMNAAALPPLRRVGARPATAEGGFRLAAGVPPAPHPSAAAPSVTGLLAAVAAALALGAFVVMRPPRRVPIAPEALALMAAAGQRTGLGRQSTRLCAAATGDLGACHNGKFLTTEQKAELERIAQLIGTPGKGITACDEGPGTIGARFEAVGIVNTEENRRAYRQMLFEAPGANAYLSAAILDPETVFQKSANGVPFPEMLSGLGIVPGVKPHLKVYELPGQSGSTVMQGLDSLAARCREYAAAGCKFAKWRSPLTIDVANGQPSLMVIEANMTDLARYALICQAEGLVPIVEPDISLSGDHDLETAVWVNVKVQSVLYKAMLDHGVFMEGTILKANMVNPGKRCATPYTVEEIATANLAVLRRCLPAAIRSVNFLSGGQSLEDAAARLSVMNQLKGPHCPWNLSFSWSAALQLPLFALCKGHDQLRLTEMAELYVAELKIAGAAARGEWTPPGTAGAHVPK